MEKDGMVNFKNESFYKDKNVNKYILIYTWKVNKTLDQIQGTFNNSKNSIFPLNSILFKEMNFTECIIPTRALTD
jgi:hypothetical protein